MTVPGTSMPACHAWDLTHAEYPRVRVLGASGSYMHWVQSIVWHTGGAPSAPDGATGNPAAPAGRDSSASRGRSRGRGWCGPSEQMSGRSDWRPQHVKSEPHALPAGRARRPRQPGARQFANGSKHAERPSSGAARDEQLRRDARVDGARQQGQHSSPNESTAGRRQKQITNAERSIVIGNI